MLVPEVLEVLGGQVEELDVARQRLVQELIKPARGKRWTSFEITHDEIPCLWSDICKSSGMANAKTQDERPGSNPVLESVVIFIEELAYKQAKEADHLLSQGVYLGPLHGIPYGLTDIIVVPQYKTTWGSKSFKDQVLDIEAWVYKRLRNAGAVLVAKLVSGSLAYYDIWFGGRTKNPWNIEEYSTGSSAGPASSTSAGMVPFVIGSETAGSMTYPAARKGMTALRPTFGTVGRTGVMSLSESLVVKKH